MPEPAVDDRHFVVRLLRVRTCSRSRRSLSIRDASDMTADSGYAIRGAVMIGMAFLKTWEQVSRLAQRQIRAQC
jgi:hypothetical protein